MSKPSSNIERAYQRLSDTVAFLETLAEQYPFVKEGLLRNKQELKAAAESLRNDPHGEPDQRYSDLQWPDLRQSLYRRGPWLKRAAWLQHDRPDWMPSTKEYEASWSVCPPRESEAIREEVRKVVMEAAQEKNDASVHWPPIENAVFEMSYPRFLRGVVIVYAYVDFEDSSWDACFAVMETEDGYKAKSFDFGGAEIHSLNSSRDLQLVGHELAYLRYFLYVVRGAAGAFRLLEGRALEDAMPYLSAAAEDPREEVPIGEEDFDVTTIPSPALQFLHIGPHGGLAFRAWILYSGIVFKSELVLFPTGMIEMTDDEPQSRKFDKLVELTSTWNHG